MALTNLLPRTVNTTGASCTGVDGAINRTYTLPDSGTLSSGIDIIINGTTLMEGVGNDFTMSGSVITFLNNVDNTDLIRVNYFITFGAPAAAALSTSTSLKYATPLMLAEALGISRDVPSWDVAGTPTKEVVGIGDNSETTFYLDQQNVLSDSYILYHGPDADTLTTLTETTHYDLDTDTGELVLTSDGVTEVGTDNIYAVYKYIENGMKDSYLISVLSRAEKEVDGMINSTFTDGSVTNPAYPIETEIQPSEGLYQSRILTKFKPLIDIESALDGDITDSDTTISLESAQGGEQFPSSGYIIIGSEIITYTGISGDDLTGCSRGVLGTTAAAHSNGDAIHSTIVFRSDTAEGTAVSWTVQPWQTHIYADENGLIYKFKDASPDSLSAYGVAERIKIIYLYGYNIVPGDITRLTLILAKRMFITDNVGKSLIQGRNEFRPEMTNVDIEEINRIVGSWVVLPMGNT